MSYSHFQNFIPEISKGGKARIKRRKKSTKRRKNRIYRRYYIILDY